MGSPQPKKASRKIESLDWRTMAQSSALKGMTSFLDVTPEEARGGNYPDGLQEFTRVPLDTMSPVAIMSSPDTLPPDAVVSPDDSLTSADTVSPIDLRSSSDMQSSHDIMSSPDIMSPADMVTAPDTLSSVYALSSPNIESSPDTMSPPDIHSPMHSVSSGDVLSKRRSHNIAAGSVPTRNRRIIPCRLAQDGHTNSEELVYKVLWDKTNADNRTVRMGYSEISAKTRLSARTIFRMIPILKQKLSIDVIEEHRSGDLIPKLYRVYSYKEILDRRRSKGMEYVIRGTSVTFVNADGEVIDLDKRREVPPDTQSSGDNQSSPATMSSDDFQSIADDLIRFWSVDEAGIRNMISACRAIRDDATTEEIRFFVQEKIAIVRSNRNIHSPSGFVLSTVPQCFAGKTFELFRARRAEHLRLAAEEEERKGREEEATRAWIRQKAESILADPKSGESARKEAERSLRALGER